MRFGTRRISDDGVVVVGSLRSMLFLGSFRRRGLTVVCLSGTQWTLSVGGFGTERGRTRHAAEMRVFGVAFVAPRRGMEGGHVTFVVVLTFGDGHFFLGLSRVIMFHVVVVVLVVVVVGGG